MRLLDNKVMQYMERIYGYAINNTYSRDEAEELSQEIIFQAVNSLDNLADQSKLEPWLWSVAENVLKVFRRKRGRERAIYSYDNLESLSHYDEYPFENNELYEYVRKQIAYLSCLYRDILICYYYDNLTCKEISEKLSIPQGTVKRRLFEGRIKIKKECFDMTETALKPIQLNISISGEGNYNGKDIPFPWQYIKDSLSQNILWYAYREPKNVEDLSKLTGTPAYFIEDALKNLIEREAITRFGKDKFQTSLIIYDEKSDDYSKTHMSNFIDEVSDDFITCLRNLTQNVMKLDFYKASKTEDELIYLFGLMALTTLSKQYNPIPTIPVPIRYDGHEWVYHAFKANSRSCSGLSTNKCETYGERSGYSHVVYSFANFQFKWMMSDSEIKMCEKLNISENPSDNDKELLTIMLRDGFLIKENDKLKLSMPYLTIAQVDEFDQLSEKYFIDFMPQYCNALNKYISGYEKTFPVQVKNDAVRNSHSLFVTMFTEIANHAIKKGALKAPPEDSVCDVLYQWDILGK